MKYFTTLYKLFSKGGGNSFIRLFSVLFLVFIASTTLQAQTVITHDIGTQGNLVIPGTSQDSYIITGTTTTNTVTIQSGYNGTITLKDLKITRTSTVSSNVTVEGLNNRSNMDPVTKVNIILDGVNELKNAPTGSGVTSDFCALQVNQGAQIHISAIDPNNDASGTLIAKATAKEPGDTGDYRTGNAGTAIGARTYASGASLTEGKALTNCSGSTLQNTAGGNIIISSGTITAWGGHGAGIGGGWYTYYDGIIIIYGGIIEARSARHSAGIGSGCPNGNGVEKNCYTSNSAILVLPPAYIKAYGAATYFQEDASLALAGAKNITYMNDPNKSFITVRTGDNEPNAYIYLDLTETISGTIKLTDIFTALGINYDLKKVRVGKTDATTKKYTFNAEFQQMTTFFTDASSSHPDHLGRPYMPVKTTVVGNNTNNVEIVLPLLGTEISFTDFPSTPLEVGYSKEQAEENAFKIKVEYTDSNPMTNVNFQMQGGQDFDEPFFLDANRVRLPSAPTTFNENDVYYIVLPIKEGRPMGAYSDVLLIDGDWNSFPLPGYIRRIGEQKVVYNDTETNSHIKVTALPKEFVVTHPTTDKVTLTLNINHPDYKPMDVTAKYLVTTEADYDAALSATPLSSWTNLNIPQIVNGNATTEVFFNNKGIYYIHWYVESGVVYAHSRPIASPPHDYGGFGPYIIVDPVTVGSLSGNSYVCSGQIPLKIKGEPSVGGSESFAYQWQISTDNGITWTNVGGNTSDTDYSPQQLTVSSTWYRRLTTDNQYGGVYPSEIFKIYIVNNGQTLYWKKGATNRNWNDPANWVDASGVAQNMVPLTCSNVYIPSGADNYPSLALSDTPIDVYSSPKCDNITFAYGAELAYQHNLTYEKAHVQYNFGYYNSLVSGEQPTETKDGGSAIKMKREQWYPLAAPLKKMASGDFSFGGYPFTWQALADGVSGDDNFYSINFNKSNVNNDVDLSTTNNSIAVKVALYKAGVNTTGYNDHKHLQALKGVLEIPYFENSLEIPYHPGHSYETIAKRSKFYYFNSATLQQIHNPIGQMNRGNEAYRFVFEDKIENVAINGVETSCYTVKVSPNSTNKHALIGNPFMAAINMERFYEVNAGVLSNVGYYAYDNTGTGVWKNYTYTLNNGVNSLQAFVVVFKGNAANQILHFPLEGEYGLTGSTTTRIPRRMQQPSALSVRVSNDSGLGGDFAELSPVNNIVRSELTGDVRKLIGDESATPEVFFVNHNNAAYNLVQAYNEGEKIVDLGIRSSDAQSQLTLSFDKIKEFAQLTGTTPVLVDKYLNVEQDLAQNNTYIFKKELTDDGKGNYTNTSRFSLRFAGIENTADDAIDVVYQQGNLTVEFTKGITNVKVYNILGQLVFDSKTLKGNNTYYSRSISLEKGSYIVRVNTVDDKSLSCKIMATN